MKKIIFWLFFIYFVSFVSGEEKYPLKLRTHHHDEFLRIVLEGVEPIISKAVVNQRGKDILVRFPDAAFSVQPEKGAISYKISKDGLLFSPGAFNRLQAFSLKYPSRLVIDVYQIAEKEAARKVVPPADGLRPQKITTVVIDPGHGGYESGITARDNKEKTAALDIAKMLTVLVNKEFTRCVLTRESDHFMTIGERAEIANRKHADIFISLHIGRHRDIILYAPVITDSTPSYIKSFLVDRGQDGFTAKTESLREALQETITEDFGENMVSTKPLSYGILSRIEAAAILIELPSFADALYNEEFKSKVANTIYKGIVSYEKNAAN